MMAKPMESLELHDPMIQFLIMRFIPDLKVWFHLLGMADISQKKPSEGRFKTSFSTKLIIP